MKQFRDKYIGKAIDIDGVAGVQCVDLFKTYCYEVCGMKPFSLGGSGYANEIVKRFKPLGLDKYFDLVPLSQAQYGDWLVWDKGSKSCPNTHVGMFVSWNSSNRALIFGQNQGQKAGNEILLYTDGVIGCLRLRKGTSNADNSQSGVSVRAGDKVRLKANAEVYATGEKIPEWVKKNSHTVQQIKSDRVLLREIYSWVYLKDVE